MIEAYRDFWKNYFNFKGRTTREEFWWVVLINVIIDVVLGIIGLTGFVSTTLQGYAIEDSAPVMASLPLAAVIVFLVYNLAVLIPELSMAFRRLKDTGLSLWWFSIVIAYAVLRRVGFVLWFDSVAGITVNLLAFLVGLSIIVIAVQPSGKFNQEN